MNDRMQMDNKLKMLSQGDCSLGGSTLRFAQSSFVYCNYSLQYAINDLSRLGYDGIEIWGGRPHMYRHDLDEEFDEILELLRQLNMKVCNFIPAQFRYPSILCSSNPRVRKDSVEYLKSAMDNAVKIGSPSISLCPGMVLCDDDLGNGWRLLKESLEEILEYNDDKGLHLLIEPAHRFETNLVLTVDDCLRLIDELDSDYLGVLIDIGHLNLNGECFREAFTRCKDLPIHVHLNDNNQDHDSHLLPGAGNADFDLLAQALKDIGYRGFVSGELSGIYSANPSGASEEMLSFMRSTFISART